MTATIEDMIYIMEGIAPPNLAEKWDNIGLQVGQKDWIVNSVWIALDPLMEVVEAACQAQIDLLITHHPLIFNPLKSIDFDSPVGQIIKLASENRLSIFTAHTNFDSASGGMNDIFASRLGMMNLRPLLRGGAERIYKLVVYVPSELEPALFSALFDAGAGVLDNYQRYTFRTRGTATFLSTQVEDEMNRNSGHRGEGEEVRIELVVSTYELPGLLNRLKSIHPAENLKYEIIPLYQPETRQGIGRCGDLPNQTDLKSFVELVKRIFGLKTVRMVGEPDLAIQKVAVCTGSGGGLVSHFLASQADVFISGDIKYHEAREVQAAKKAVIDIGHFASEHIMVPELTEQLQAAITSKNLEVSVSPCHIERDPFILI